MKHYEGKILMRLTTKILLLTCTTIALMACNWLSLFNQPQVDQLIASAGDFAAQNQFDDAIVDLTTALTLSPDNPELYILRGQMYLALYEWDAGLNDYNRAIEIAPNDPDAYFYRGVLYYSILQTGVELRHEALADFQQYLEITPSGEHAAEAEEYATQIESELAALEAP